jgi:hypothetical protein
MNIVKVFSQSGFSQGIQFFDDPAGKYDFAISAQDLADCLGLKNYKELRCKEKYKAVAQNSDSVRVASNVPVIVEPGIYESIARSEAENAEPFQDWLFEVVVTDIRKTGGYNQKSQLTPYQQKLIDYTTGHVSLQADLVERCVIYHTPALMPHLPRINPAPTVDLVLAEQVRSGLELDRCDVVMRDLLETECLRQIESNGEIKTGEVWARINDGASHDDPNERRSMKWVEDEIEKLLPYWDMNWTGKSRSRAVKWWRSAK